MPRLIAAVAAFEMRQQLRSGVFAVVFLLSFGMVLGSVSVDQLRVGLCEFGLRNGPEAIARTHLVWTLFFLFTSAAFVADAVLRDDLTGFGPIIWPMPLRRVENLLGRFVGSFLAVVACFVSVPLGLLAGSAMPWVNEGTVGPFEPAAYAIAFFTLALPNLFLGSAVAFGVARIFRSLAAVFLSALALLVLYGLGSRQDAVPFLNPLFEPFGFASFDRASGCLSGGRSLDVSSLLVGNRVLWSGIGAALIALSLLPWRARPSAVAWRTEVNDVQPVTGSTPPRPTQPHFGWATTLAQLWARLRFEFEAVVWTEAFGVLLLLGVANAAAGLWTLPTSTTDTSVITLYTAFRILPVVVILFFSGELIWRERDLNIAGLLGATPASDAVLVVPKLLALFLVLASLAITGAATAVVIQWLRASPIDLPIYVAEWVWPATYDWCLLAALAVFLQALAPNKLAGWGLFVLFLIASLAADRLGFTNPRYRFGQHPGWPLPFEVSGQPSVGLFRLYWGSASLGVAVIAIVLLGRVPEPLATRLRALPARLSGVARVLVLTGAMGFVGVGVALW